MSDNKSADEQPKKKLAKKVIATKRYYFVPDHGVSVEADDAEAAVKAASKKTTQEVKEGDA